jgi:hypothetical protein
MQSKKRSPRSRPRAVAADPQPQIGPPAPNYFDDSGLEYPQGAFADPALSLTLKALYTEPRNPDELRAAIQTTLLAICTYFQGLPEARIPSTIASSIQHLFGYMERLGRSTSRRTVITYYLIGQMLNAAESQHWFPNKAAYMRWLRDSFPNDRNLEFLRQAKKIARLGDHAIRFADLGKNRLLELFYLYNQQIQEEDDQRERDQLNPLTVAEKQQILSHLEDTLRSYGFNDVSEQDAVDVQQLRVRMDTAITQYRLQKAGIGQDICTPDQARMLALYRGLSLEKKQASQIRQRLEGKTIEEQKILFNQWVQDRMYLATDDVQQPRPMRIRAILASFKQWCDKDALLKLHDVRVLGRDRQVTESITDAYRVIMFLASELNLLNELEEPATAVAEMKATLDWRT